MQLKWRQAALGFLSLATVTGPAPASIIGMGAHPPMRGALGSVQTDACKQKHVGTNVYGNAVTLGLPLDCGASGSITIPGITQGPSGFGMVAQVCYSPQPIGGGSKACPVTSWNPQGLCKQAGSTFWYISTKFQAKILNGSGSYQVSFKSNTFPIKFTSSNFIVSGYTYGLCVISQSDVLVQDDFATGNGVSPQGDTINLSMLLPSDYLTFYYRETFLLYLEAKPA